MDVFDLGGEEDNQSEYGESEAFYAPQLKRSKSNNEEYFFFTLNKSNIFTK